MGHRICYKCKVDKPLEEFSKDSSRALGRSFRCKSCTRTQSKTHYNNQSVEKVISRQEKQKLRRRSNPEHSMWARAKARASRDNIKFTILVEDVIIPDVCPVLGIKLVLNEKYKSDNSPSLDRFDPTKGYTKQNIRVISWRANSLKKDGTLKEFRLLIKYLEEV